MKIYILYFISINVYMYMFYIIFIKSLIVLILNNLIFYVIYIYIIY